MRERRDQLRSMYPEMPFYEIIRQLAQEWNNMDREIKQVQFSEQLFLFLFFYLCYFVMEYAG